MGLAPHARLPAELTYIDQKRLELARALVLRPRLPLLLLDEWLAGLNPTDPQQGIALIQSLRTDGMTVVCMRSANAP
jgi:branched-chain amino acid transport system ATP-binding protein